MQGSENDDESVVCEGKVLLKKNKQKNCEMKVAGIFIFVIFTPEFSKNIQRKSLFPLNIDENLPDLEDVH